MVGKPIADPAANKIQPLTDQPLPQAGPSSGGVFPSRDVFLDLRREVSNFAEVLPVQREVVENANVPEVHPVKNVKNAAPTELSETAVEELRRFRESVQVNVATVETDEEKSLPESLPYLVSYALEDEDFMEEEESDALVPQNEGYPAETPPPSSDENKNAPQAPPERETP